MSKVEIDPRLARQVEERIETAKRMSKWFEHFHHFLNDEERGSILRTHLSGLDINYRGHTETKKWSDPDTGSREWDITVRKILVLHQDQVVYDFDGTDAYWSSSAGEVRIFRPGVGDWMARFEVAKTIVQKWIAEDKIKACIEKERLLKTEKERVEDDLRDRFGL